MSNAIREHRLMDSCSVQCCTYTQNQSKQLEAMCTWNSVILRSPKKPSIGTVLLLYVDALYFLALQWVQDSLLFSIHLACLTAFAPPPTPACSRCDHSSFPCFPCPSRPSPCSCFFFSSVLFSGLLLFFFPSLPSPLLSLPAPVPVVVGHVARLCSLPPSLSRCRCEASALALC